MLAPGVRTGAPPGQASQAHVCPRCGKPGTPRQIAQTDGRGVTTVVTVIAGCACDATAAVPSDLNGFGYHGRPTM